VLAVPHGIVGGRHRKNEIRNGVLVMIILLFFAFRFSEWRKRASAESVFREDYLRTCSA